MKSMRRGDTLIEVAIAIAIFSLVAIGVVGVVNTSTSAAQSALEVTLVREEIDAQAEALRFIHNSYIAGGKSNSAGNTKYKELWEKIVKMANKNNNAATVDKIMKYNPTTCKEIYNWTDGEPPMIESQNAFVINTRKLDADDANDAGNRNPVDNTNIKFFPATTYPRLIYNMANYNSSDDILLNDDTDNYLYRVEGIFVVAVPDQVGTTIIKNGAAIKTPAFYDFYIRTCWLAPGAERPSTISTVIRLQDPEFVNYNLDLSIP